MFRSLLTAGALIAASHFSASAATYYVRPGGADNKSGTSIANAWQTIGKLNGVAFGPGDTILLEGGSTFSGSIYFDSADGGSETVPVILNSYDPATGAGLPTGAPASGRATINAGTSYGLYAYNSGGLDVRNVNFAGSGATVNTNDGLSFYNDLAGNVRKKRIYVEGVEVSGFGKWGFVLGSGNGLSGYDDVRVTNSVFRHNLRGGLGTYGVAFNTATKNYANTNVYVAWCKAHNNDGDPASTTNTGNGIVLGSVNGGTIERCVAHDNGINNKPSEGPVGIWTYDATAVIIQLNESYRNRTGSTGDGDGFDLDQNVTNSVLQYNYSHDNDGAGYLVYAGIGKPNSGNVVRYNISQNDCRKLGYGAIMVAGDVNGADVYHNIVYITSPTNNTDPAAIRVSNITKTPKNVRVRNNIFITRKGVNNVRLVRGEADATYSFQRNLYFAEEGTAFRITWGATTHTSLASWLNAALTQERVGGNIVALTADPLVTNPGAAPTLDNAALLETLTAYRLQVGSPAINAGLDLAALFGVNPGARDYFGGVVPRGPAVDVGAHEANSPPWITTPAAPTGTPLALTSAFFSAAATDDEAAGSLIYSWHTVGTPSGAVTFTVNNSTTASATTASFAEPGGYTVRLTATDSLGQTAISETSVNVLKSYGWWRTKRFDAAEQADEAMSGPGADFDSDGLPNAIEYVLDLQPKASDVSAPQAPVVSLAPGALSLGFIRDTQAGGITLAVKTTTDLSSWTASGVSLTTGELSGTSLPVTGSFPIGSEPARFLRLEGTLSAP